MLNSNLAASQLDKKHRHYHVSVSLEELTERKLRDLALQENASESSIVEAALRGFFDSGSAQNLHAILARLGIASRGRDA